MLLTDDNVRSAIHTQSDEAVLQQAVSSPSLFSELVSRYEDAFLRKAKSIIRDTRLAEDIVQESFTKIYLHAANFTDTTPGSFRAWSYTIVTNTALTYYKKYKRERDARAELTNEHYESLSDGSEIRAQESDVVKDLVASVLTRLPLSTRDVLQKVYIEDRSHKDIAAEEGVSVQVVKTRAHRARAAFKKALESLQ